jgi:hypothetical protein
MVGKRFRIILAFSDLFATCLAGQLALAAASTSSTYPTAAICFLDHFSSRAAMFR